jgi:hypothetical protein
MNYHGHTTEEKRQIMIVVSEQIPFKTYNSKGKEKKEEEEIPSAMHLM